MPVDDLYRRQVDLLVRTLPFVAEEKNFALKGGTAINLFVRDMPRLSVDIDLTYLSVAGREESLKEIDTAMRRIAERISASIPRSNVHLVASQEKGHVTRLIVRAEGVQIKIEVTPVTRGCVYQPEYRPVSSKVEEKFGYAEIQVVSFADLYAGKLVAALDRQHPRDLFDVRDLLENEGIDEDLRKAFIVYILSHNRPFSEVLAPNRLDISEEFLHGFNGMTENPVNVEELVQAREDLIADIVGKMPEPHRRFLISVKAGNPQWELLGIDRVNELPAVRWRLENLARLDARKRAAMLGRLREVLQVKD